MCGLVGVLSAYPLSELQKKVFNDLFYIDALRGKDSSGVGFINKEGPSYVLKDIGLPEEVMNNSHYMKKIDNKHLIALIGHNRAATLGEITRKNAHPFIVRNVIFTHNGTLYNKTSLPTKIICDTDSETLANSIVDAGIHKTYEELDGAAACVWWDIWDACLYMFTNGERPLYIAQHKYSQVLYWASEKWMLEAITNRNKVDLKYIKKVESDTLISVFIKDAKLEIMEDTLTPKVHYRKNKRYDGWADYWGNIYDYEPIEEIKTTKTTPVKNNVISLPNKITEKAIKKVLKPLRIKTITVTQYKNIFSNVGCIVCGEDIKEQYDTSVLVGKNKEDVICSQCAELAILAKIPHVLT